MGVCLLLGTCFFLVFLLFVSSTSGTTMQKDPAPQANKRCTVYNWRRMVCAWTPTIEQQRAYTGLVTNQTLYWSNRPNKGMHPCPLQGVHQDTCNFTDARNLTNLNLNLSVVVNISAIDRVWSPIVTIDTTFIVKPDPVTRMTHSASSRVIALHWAPPVGVSERRLQYRVNYTSQWEPHNIKTEILANLTSLNRSHLVPNTKYTITIECIPLVRQYGPGERKKYVPRGYWSNATTRNINTLTSVPGMAPEVSDGSFTVSKISTITRNIMLYSKSIPAQVRHGTVEAVRVCGRPVTELGMCQLSDVDDCPHHKDCICQECTINQQHCPLSNISSQEAYVLTVNARTDKGYNEALSLRPITVMSQEDIKPMHQVLESVVVIGDNNGPGAHVNWTKVPRAVQYTVYIREKGKKDSDLRWVTVPGSQEHEYIPLDTEYANHVFAVSAERHIDDVCDGHLLASSGMLFYTACIYDIHRSIAVPSEFGFAPWEDQQGESLLVNWTNPKCTESGYIQNYTIRVCTPHNCQRGVYDSTTVVSAKEERCQIPNLQAGEEYYAEIQSVSPSAATDFITTDTTYTVTHSGLSGRDVSLIVFGCLLVMAIACIGAYTVTKYCRKRYKAFAQGPIIVLPDRDDVTMTSRHNGVDPGNLITTISYSPHSPGASEALLSPQGPQNDVQRERSQNGDLGVPVDSLRTEPLLPPALPPPNASRPGARADYLQLIHAPATTTDYLQQQQGPTDYIQQQQGPTDYIQQQRGPTNYVQQQQGPADYIQQQRGPTDYIQQQQGPTDYIQQQQGPTDYIQQQRGPTDYIQQQQGPTDYIQQQQGPTDYKQQQQGPTDDIQQQQGPTDYIRQQQGPTDYIQRIPEEQNLGSFVSKASNNNNEWERSKHQRESCTSKPSPSPRPDASEKAARREQSPKLDEQPLYSSREPKINSGGYVQSPSPSADVEPHF